MDYVLSHSGHARLSVRLSECLNAALVILKTKKARKSKFNKPILMTPGHAHCIVQKSIFLQLIFCFAHFHRYVNEF